MQPFALTLVYFSIDCPIRQDVVMISRIIGKSFFLFPLLTRGIFCAILRDAEQMFCIF